MNEIITVDENNIEIVNSNNVSINNSSNIIITKEPDEYAVTVNKKEYIITGDTLYIPKRYEDAPQWLRDLIDTVTNDTFNQKITEINSLTQTLNQLIVELDVAKNTYTQSIISSNDINERINTAITTLNSSLLENDATILDVATTKTTPEEAQSLAINVLSASINDTASGTSIGSIVSEINDAVATGDYTNAQSIEAVSSAFQGSVESIGEAIDVINSFAGIDEAGAYTYTGLTGYLADPETGILGGGKSELNNTITAKTDSVEAKFEYGSNIKLGGQYYNSGFGLKAKITGGDGSEADPYDSEFWINAEKFKFTNNAVSGQVAPFTIDATGITPEITFNGLVDFTNVTNTELGFANEVYGGNRLKNSEMRIEATNTGTQWLKSDLWSSRKAGTDEITAGVTWNKNGVYPDNSLINGSTAWLKQTGSETTCIADLVFDDDGGQFTYLGHSVYEGEWYQVSMYLGSVNCKVGIYVVFSDALGSIVNFVAGQELEGKTGGSYLEDFHNYYINVQVPAGAKYATIMARKYGTLTGSESLLVVSKPQMIQTRGSADRRISYSENGNASGIASMAYSDLRNVTTIDGGKITTGTVDADQIASEAIAGKTITGGTISGAIINGVQINGAIIKGSFIDLSSSLTLTNWKFYTPATVPAEYIDNFAHNNDGTLTVDSEGYVRLPGQTNFIVGQMSSSGIIFSSDLSNVTTHPSVNLNLQYDLYSWDSYNVSTLQRSIRQNTQFASSANFVFSGKIITSGVNFGGSGTDVNNYGTYNFRILDKEISVSIQASNGNQHNAEIAQIFFDGSLVAYADGRFGETPESDPSDSAWIDFNSIIKGLSINIKITFDGLAGYTFTMTVFIVSNSIINNHTINDIFLIRNINHSLNTANSSVVGHTICDYSVHFPSVWIN